MIQLIGDGGHAAVIRTIPGFNWLQGWLVAVGDNQNRRKEAETLGDVHFAILAHPSAHITQSVQIGIGTVVMAGAIIQTDVTIGKHCIINTGAQLDHHCKIGDYAHIAPGCVLCGSVTVGDGAFLGAGCIAVPGAVVEPWAYFKAGSTIK